VDRPLAVVCVRDSAAAGAAVCRHRPLDRPAPAVTRLMTRRTQINVALAAAVILLGGLLWLSQPKPPAPPQPLPDTPPANIHRVEIHPGGGVQPMVLEREQDQWRLTSPVTARANEHRIDALLAMARITPQRRIPADAIKASKTGLDQPLATVRFNNGA